MRLGRLKLWERFTVPDTQVDGEDYLRRIYIIECPFFSILLHRLGGPDRSLDRHDHPWSFVSFILSNGYTEEVMPSGGKILWGRDDQDAQRGPRTVRRRFINFKRAKTSHRIVFMEFPSKPCWTLLFCGPRHREWGFHTDEGWVHFKDYDEAEAARKIVQWRKDREVWLG